MADADSIKHAKDFGIGIPVKAENPLAMLRAIRCVVHDGYSVDKAYGLLNDMKKEAETK